MYSLEFALGLVPYGKISELLEFFYKILYITVIPPYPYHGSPAYFSAGRNVYSLEYGEAVSLFVVFAVMTFGKEFVDVVEKAGIGAYDDYCCYVAHLFIPIVLSSSFLLS